MKGGEENPLSELANGVQPEEVWRDGVEAIWDNEQGTYGMVRMANVA